MTFAEILEFFRNSKNAIETLKTDPNFPNIGNDENLIKEFKKQVFDILKNNRNAVIEGYKGRINDDLNEVYTEIASLEQEINQIGQSGQVPSASEFLYEEVIDTGVPANNSPKDVSHAMNEAVAQKLNKDEEAAALEAKVNNTNKIRWELAAKFEENFQGLYDNNAKMLGTALFAPNKEGLLQGDLSNKFYDYDAVEMLEFFNFNINDELTINNLFKDVKLPELSASTTKYMQTGKTGLESIELISNPQAPMDQVKMNSFNIDANTLKSVLEGYQGNDGKEYEDRLAKVCAIMAYDKDSQTRNVNGQKINFIRYGLIKNDDPEELKMAKYINDLLSKGKAFRNDGDKYPIIDVNKIAESAKQYKSRYYYDNKTLDADFRDMKEESRKLDMDMIKISSKFENIESSDDFKKAFTTLLNDTLDGKSGIEMFGNQPMQRTAKNIGDVSAYLLKMYEKQENETLSIHGVTPDFVTKTCYEALDSDISSKDFMQTFNSQLNRYNLAGADLVAYNRTAAERAEIDPKTGRKENEIAYQKALVKVEGLKCDGDDPILTDAICTYARLKDVHDKRPWYFKFIHPINNYREGKTVENMEGILQHDFDITPQDLETKVAEIKRSGLYYDSINKAAKVCEDKNSFDALETEAQERQSQRNAVINKQLKNLTKYGTRTVPESENPNLEKLTTNSRIKALKEVYVEKEYQYSSFESEFKGKDIETVLKDFESEIAQVTTMKSDSELKKYILSNNINCLKDLNEDDIRALKANNPDIYPKSMSSDEVKKIYSKGQNLLSQEKINELRENNPAYKECSDERIQMLYSVQGHMRTKSTANIEKFIDWDGYNKDDIDKSVDLQNEVKIRREFLGKENPSQEERALFDKQMKYFDEKKQLYEINRQERVENFYLKYDEFMDQKDLEAIDKATGLEKETLQAKYEIDKKQREDFKKEVAERQIKHGEKKQLLNESIEKTNEEIDLVKSYKEVAIKSKDDSTINKSSSKDFNKMLGQDSQIINVEKNDVAKKVENKPQVKEIEPLKKDK